MNTAVVDFVASLSLLTRGVQGGIAMVGYFPQIYSQVLGAPGSPIEDAAQRKMGKQNSLGKRNVFATTVLQNVKTEC